MSRVEKLSKEIVKIFGLKDDFEESESKELTLKDTLLVVERSRIIEKISLLHWRKKGGKTFVLKSPIFNGIRKEGGDIEVRCYLKNGVKKWVYVPSKKIKKSEEDGSYFSWFIDYLDNAIENNFQVLDIPLSEQQEIHALEEAAAPPPEEEPPKFLITAPEEDVSKELKLYSFKNEPTFFEETEEGRKLKLEHDILEEILRKTERTRKKEEMELKKKELEVNKIKRNEMKEERLKSFVPTEELTKVYDTVKKTLQDSGEVMIYDEKMNVVSRAHTEDEAIDHLIKAIERDLSSGEKKAAYIGSKYAVISLRKKGDETPAIHSEVFEMMKDLDLTKIADREKAYSMLELMQRGVKSTDFKSVAEKSIHDTYKDPNAKYMTKKGKPMKMKHYTKEEIAKLKKLAMRYQ